MKNQFQTLQNWTREVLKAIKKEIKSDHLPTNPALYRAYFGNRPQSRLSSEEIFAAYEKELLKGDQELADWVVSCWVLKHGDLYQHFSDRLTAINPDFDQIQELTEEESERVLDGAAASFGAIPTFLFALLNGVVFPKEILERLQKSAEIEKSAVEKTEALDAEQQSLEKTVDAQRREIARLQDKIAGVQKKYTADTEALKKRIKTLQQKLHAR